MPLILPTANATPADAGVAWQAFLYRRETLVRSMHLSVCNGCDGCGDRCTGGFLVTREENDAVQAFRQTRPASEIARIDAQNKIVPWPGAEDSGATVTLCRYRDTERGNCSVYPARPTVCRLFGQTAWLPCPIEAVPAYPGDAPAVWNAYRRFDRRTWEAWGNPLEATLAAQSVPVL